MVKLMAMKDSSFKFALALLICFLSFDGIAQSTSSGKSNRHWVFYGGVGPNIYFNNLVVAKNFVNELNYSFVGRIMWEPEHRLSIGFESGYNRLYTINESSAQIINSSIPLQVVVSMRFLKRFYGNFSYGRSILLNKVNSTTYGNLDASSLSLADVTLTVGYKRKLNERISLGAETKFYHASKANDENLALVFMCSYRIK
jgi:hypothetical protein